MNHLNENSIVFHWEMFSKEKQINESEEEEEEKPVFYRDVHVEVYDFVFLKQQLIGHFQIDKD